MELRGVYELVGSEESGKRTLETVARRWLRHGSRRGTREGYAATMTLGTKWLRRRAGRAPRAYYEAGNSDRRSSTSSASTQYSRSAPWRASARIASAHSSRLS